MAIDQPQKIDAIGIDKATAKLVLTISDHLPWLDDSNGHRSLLRDKLNTYLAFIESGELQEVYPDSTGRPVKISVVGKYELPQVGVLFYENASQVLASTGVELEFVRLDPAGQD